MAIPGYYSLLQRGSSGPDVALVQTWLNGVRDAYTWYSELKTDGKFGISTENAVKEFQLKNKMNVDGKVGANTWNVLYARYTAKHGLTVPYPGIVLHTGSSGGTVRLVQQKLNAEGERLTSLAVHGATMVIFLSIGLVDKVQTALLQGAYTEATPAAVVYKATWPEQKTVHCTVGTLAASTRAAGITKTALIVVGDFLAAQYDRSKLYDPTFTTEYRKGAPQ